MYEIAKKKKIRLKDNGPRNWLFRCKVIRIHPRFCWWAFVGVSYFGIFRVSVAEKLTKCSRTCLPSFEFVWTKRGSRGTRGTLICRGCIE